MASVKFGTIVTDMKGKAGGQTFKGTKAGGALQNNSAKSSGGKITKADAGRGVPSKKILAGIATAWKNLDDSERGTWDVGAINFPFLNRFGESYTGSGYQVFMSLNLARIAAGLSFLQECPVPQSLTPCPSFSIDPDTPPAITVESDFASDTDFVFNVYATAGQSVGRAFEIGRTKQIITITAAQFDAGFDIGPAYLATFGALLAGAKVYVYIEPVNSVSGQIAQPSVLSFIAS